ncbi:hypothetical protein [Nocardia wallacei]|uniref:hypothetical protein n=1 Tax=Nocardia wallacei TaxID=480035 RepID=UPI0024587A67|nr:hypothetical protein [Nocardia wallacei]
MIIATLFEFAGHAWEAIAATPHQVIASVADQDTSSTTLLEASQSRAFGVPPVDIV